MISRHVGPRAGLVPNLHRRRSAACSLANQRCCSTKPEVASAAGKACVSVDSISRLAHHVEFRARLPPRLHPEAHAFTFGVSVGIGIYKFIVTDLSIASPPARAAYRSRTQPARQRTHESISAPRLSCPSTSGARWLSNKLFTPLSRAASPIFFGGVCSSYNCDGEPGGSSTAQLKISKSAFFANRTRFGTADAIHVSGENHNRALVRNPVSYRRTVAVMCRNFFHL